MKIIGTLVLALFLTGCTSEVSARKVLADQGYTRIEITGYRYFGCSADDEFHTGFKAVSPAGHEVSGVVCAGWMKGETIRFD